MEVALTLIEISIMLLFVVIMTSVMTLVAFECGGTGAKL